MTESASLDQPVTVERLIAHRLQAALGGWRGAVDTALPTVVFVVVWLWRHQILIAVLASGAVIVVLALVRLGRRERLQHLGGALVATALAAWFALRSGRAEDAFLPGLVLSGIYGAGSVISIVAGWPLVGFLVGLGDPAAATDPFRWRANPAIVAVCRRLTWILVAVYAVRLLVMVPLYLAGNVAALGAAKIALGWPLWLGGLAAMGLLLSRGHTPLASAAETDPGHSSSS